MIIEIGPSPYVAEAYGEQALFFSTDAPAPRDAGPEVLRSLGELAGALKRPDVRLVVCRPGVAAPWSARSLGRALFSRRMLQRRSNFAPAFALEVMVRAARAPVAVVDHEDLPVINPYNLRLLDRSRIYFKRELPPDHWRAFMKTAHPHLPTPRFRKARRQIERMRKLRPIAIGLPKGAVALLPPPGPEKRVDVFFSGRVDDSSTVRARGLAELRDLAAQGRIRLDVPDRPLPREAFYQRCAAAWLVWSPEGLGWDCFRHYEAPACGSTPLINQPSIERYRPLIQGEHALYYDPEPGGLTRAVTMALQDRALLERIAAAGRARVLAHHTAEALARHVVETTLALTAAPGPPPR